MSIKKPQKISHPQTKYRKHYQRSLQFPPDVVLLQDVKDLAMYLLSSPLSLELINFLHLPIVDRFLRALILYLQHYLTTWTELGTKRAATSKRAPNPLAGGARVQRAEEMRSLRCLLAREYTDLLMGCQPEARRYHHSGAGVASFAQSNAEKDLRMYEGLVQFAHRVAWIALERKQKDLIGNGLFCVYVKRSIGLTGKGFVYSGHNPLHIVVYTQCLGHKSHRFL